ncbi:MAG TPA: DUF3352 domain-containing protein [Pirellulales bacterium]|nr:DUF3352 domain-containing protein [Pirellulales bacterium]
MRRRFALLLVCLVGLCDSVARGQATDAAKLAPETAVWYAELANPGPLLDFALASKTRKLLENVEGYQKYLRSDQYQQLQAVVGVLETRLGTTWEAAVRDLLGGGVSANFDPATQSGLIAIRSRNPGLLAKLNGTLAELIEADAKMNGRPSPVKSKEYQGFTGWSFGGDAMHVVVDDLLLISNKSEVLKSAIDRYRDPAAKNLAANAEFAQCRSKQPAGALGWSWLNLAALRQDAHVQQALNKRSDNPLIELLLAGVIEAIKQAPYVTSSVSYDADTLRLRTELPRQASTTSASRAWFFARQADETALMPPGTIGAFTMFRDLAGLWLARDELFDETVVARFAQADTQFGLFFSGRDFGPEVLGELDAPVQLIVARQEYGADKPTPALKLPAFGLVFKLKHPDDFAPELLMAYQKIIGIVNITGAQQGKPQLLLSTEEYRGTTISKSAYLHNAKVAKDKAPVQYNFGPACARIDDHFVLGSTVGIVRQVVDALKPGGTAAALKDNTAFTIEAAPLAAILADNQELLITQNMLGQGHSRPEAETAVQALLDLLAQLDRFVLRMADDPDKLAIEAVLRLRGAGE